MADSWLGEASSIEVDAAVQVVDEWLVSLGARRLSQEEFEKRSYPAIAGWRVAFELSCGITEADILVKSTFPWAHPTIFLVDPPGFPSFPHVEASGRLCVFPSGAEWDTTDPKALMIRTVTDASRLLEAGATGANDEDFRREITSYWDATPGLPAIHSLVSPGGPSREVLVFRGKDFVLIGNAKDEMGDWLSHRFPSLRARRTYERGLLCWLDRAPLPRAFPCTVSRVLGYVERAGLLDDLSSILASGVERTTIVLGFRSGDGNAFLSVDVQPSRTGHRRGTQPLKQWLADGFRPGRLPEKLAASRFLNNAILSRQDVRRVDARWIHGRDNNPDLEVLRAAQVALVGCGSLGSAVARLLAQSGVGAFVFIDPQTLASANTGRHLLGSSSVGLFKATEVARRLEGDLPHLYESHVVVGGWEDAAAKQPKTLLEADLVISTVGSWTRESLLDRWLADRRPKLPVIYGWTEPYAAAGHAVLVDRSVGTGCLACGMSAAGEPRLRVTDWAGSTLKQEAACGAFFQPYGPVQLEHVATLVAATALDRLLGQSQVGEEHRVWVGAARQLEQAGGKWSNDWLKRIGQKESGDRKVALAWTQDPSCQVCGGAR
ncbi:E2/UBC family protein [Caulobacter radicis]|nr:E2/UBC family protein [Caulobacter radicis]